MKFRKTTGCYSDPEPACCEPAEPAEGLILRISSQSLLTANNLRFGQKCCLKTDLLSIRVARLILVEEVKSDTKNYEKD